jgi:hypothetical protein
MELNYERDSHVQCVQRMEEVVDAVYLKVAAFCHSYEETEENHKSF